MLMEAAVSICGSRFILARCLYVPPLPHYERKFVDEDSHCQWNLRREFYVCPEVAVVFYDAYSLLPVQKQILATTEIPKVAFER